MFFCCVDKWIMGVSVFVRPFGPQISKVHRSISSVEVFWLVFSVLIVAVRCGMLKKASWLKKRLRVLGFCGFERLIVLVKSLYSKTPIRVAISATSLIVFGIVIVVVVCSVEIFVMVPARIDIIISRDRGLAMVFVSLLVLWFVRG